MDTYLPPASKDKIESLETSLESLDNNDNEEQEYSEEEGIDEDEGEEESGEYEETINESQEVDQDIRDLVQNRVQEFSDRLADVIIDNVHSVKCPNLPGIEGPISSSIIQPGSEGFYTDSDVQPKLPQEFWDHLAEMDKAASVVVSQPQGPAVGPVGPKPSIGGPQQGGRPHGIIVPIYSMGPTLSWGLLRPGPFQRRPRLPPGPTVPAGPTGPRPGILGPNGIGPQFQRMPQWRQRPFPLQFGPMAMPRIRPQFTRHPGQSLVHQLRKCSLFSVVASKYYINSGLLFQ